LLRDATPDHDARDQMFGGADDASPRLDDAGLFRGNFLDGMAEIVFVVEINLRDHGDFGRQNVCSVQPAAHPDFANRELGPRLKAAVAASAELQERDALKSVGLAAAMATALVARGVAEPTAHLAAELGVLAFKRGYAEWSQGDRGDDDGLARYTLAALDELRAATAALG